MFITSVLRINMNLTEMGTRGVFSHPHAAPNHASTAAHTRTLYYNYFGWFFFSQDRGHRFGILAVYTTEYRDKNIKGHVSYTFEIIIIATPL